MCAACRVILGDLSAEIDERPVVAVGARVPAIEGLLEEVAGEVEEVFAEWMMDLAVAVRLLAKRSVRPEPLAEVRLGDAVGCGDRRACESREFAIAHTECSVLLGARIRIGRGCCITTAVV